ncbi:MAG: serine hydrolase [Chlamydiia bacterium]|nr:serine hydrolase [Chlamydiia bacterium]
MARLWLIFFLSIYTTVQAGLFDWFHSLSPKGKRAQAVLTEFEPKVEEALKEYQVPGLAIGVIVDHELVYAKGFGYRDLEKKLPMTTETLFGVGSCTKAFTAFLAGMFVDEGKLSRDTPVFTVLHDLRLWNYDVTYHLTFRDVLTHRSGLPRHDFLWYNANMERNELLKKLQYLEPACHLRQRYLYNNLMYVTAGIALEKIGNQSWEDLVTAKILKPLGMQATNFSIEKMKQSRDHAIPYIEKGKKIEPMTIRDFSIIGPAGSMNSNIEDLALWLRLHLNEGILNNQKFLQSSTLQEMLIPQVITGGTPEVQDISFYSYGIGWNISSYRGRYLVSHDGGVDGYTSVVAFFPRENVGIVILANKNLSVLPRFLSFQVQDLVLELSAMDWLKEGLESLKKTRDLADSTPGAAEPMRKTGTQPSHSLSDFVGKYEHPGYGVLSIDLENGKLKATLNDFSYLLEHWHYDVFVIAEDVQQKLISLAGTKCSFHTNISGDIAEVAIPFESNVKEIVFHKKQEPALQTLAYLRQFTGQYEIYGYTVDIHIRNGTLHAAIPGQPLYELVPTAENEFSVKAKTGYNVRFVLDSNGLVSEVLLMQPYGTFSAKPKI